MVLIYYRIIAYSTFISLKIFTELFNETGLLEIIRAGAICDYQNSVDQSFFC